MASIAYSTGFRYESERLDVRCKTELKITLKETPFWRKGVDTAICTVKPVSEWK